MKKERNIAMNLMNYLQAEHTGNMEEWEDTYTITETHHICTNPNEIIYTSQKKIAKKPKTT